MAGSLNALIPELRPWARQLVAVAGRAGLQPRVTSTYRSHSEQARLYRQYQTGGRAYPVAPPGSSAHEYGYAFDMVIAGMDPQDFRDLGTVWESWGGVWGGALNDPIHFEYPGFSIGGSSFKSARRARPQEGGSFYKLANFLASFTPLGVVQIVDALVSALDGNDDLASWYLNHPTEAARDLLKYLF